MEIELEIKVNSITSASKELIVSIPLQEFQSRINLSYQEFQKNFEIKGFRKGRVPLQLIKKLYGKQIEEDVVTDLATDLFKQAIEKEKIQLVGKPVFLEHRVLNEHVDFVFNYDVIPDFSISEYKGIKIFEPVHRVDDDEIQRELNSLMFSINKTKNIEKVIHSNVLVKCQIQELDNETEKPKEDGKSKPLSVNLSDPSLPKQWLELFWDKSVGEEFIAYPREFDNSVPDSKFYFKIVEILEPDFDKLDEEYIKHLTYGRLSTLDDYKDDIGFQLQNHWDNKSRKELEHQIIDYLVDHNNFDLPKSVLEETAIKIAEDFAKKYLKDKKLSDEEFAQLVENVYPFAQRQVKWAIIKKKIAEIEGINIEDYDIEDYANLIQQRYNIEQEEAIKIVKNDKSFHDLILDRKVMDFLISFAETEEIEFKEYYKKMEHHHHYKEVDSAIESMENVEEVKLTEDLKEEQTEDNFKKEE
ncbi:MAG: trigger factor [Candidatus Kapaibacteriales bacterium]